ncbi:MAG: TIGR03936 family radical SAM-associated protein [Evtepia sp.]
MPELRICFSKLGTARYISHLDLMRTMQRALLRAGISIRHTNGFHPHPYISIPLPLPLGFSSECEILEFGLEGGATIGSVPSQINAALPSGITVQRCYEKARPFKQLAFVRYEITLEFESACADAAALAFRDLISQETLLITKRSKSKTGFSEIDLIPLIDKVETVHPMGNVLHLSLILQAQNPGLNPDILITAFRKAYDQPFFASFHRKAILDEEKNPFE